VLVDLVRPEATYQATHIGSNRVFSLTAVVTAPAVASG